jgi:hypothetical protein
MLAPRAVRAIRVHKQSNAAVIYRCGCFEEDEYAYTVLIYADFNITNTTRITDVSNTNDVNQLRRYHDCALASTLFADARRNISLFPP